MERAQVRYIVRDVGAAIQFYTTYLGLELELHPAPGFAALSRGALQLLLNAPGTGGGGQRGTYGTSPQPGGWNRIQLQVEDLASMRATLAHHGVHFRGEVLHGQGGEQLLIEDPSGNPIEIFQPHQDQLQPVPAEYHTVTPFLTTDDVDSLLAFIEKAFAAQVAHRTRSQDGTTRHATVKIGDSPLMLSSGNDLYGRRPATLHLYVSHVDETYCQALAAGALALEAPRDQPYGDRRAGVRDAWGNHWWIAARIAQVDTKAGSTSEAERRHYASSEVDGAHHDRQ